MSLIFQQIDKQKERIALDITVLQAMQAEMGQIIREKRQDKKVSLRDMAQAIRISAPFLSDIELGRRSPSKEVQDRIELFLLWPNL